MHSQEDKIFQSISDLVDNNLLSDEQMKILVEIEHMPDAIDYVPNHMVTPWFNQAMIHIRPSLLSRIHKDFRTASVCALAFEKDIQLISHIPDKFITEEMMYKAVKLNVGLLRSPRDNNFLSDRIVRFALSVNPESWIYLPKEFRTKEYAIFAFDETGKLPIGLDDLNIAVDAVKTVLKCEKLEFKNKITFKEISDSLEKYQKHKKDAILTASDNVFQTALERAVACLALRLDEPDQAGEMVSKHPELEYVVMEMYGEDKLDDLVKSSNNHLLKRRAAESSLDL